MTAGVKAHRIKKPEVYDKRTAWSATSLDLSQEAAMSPSRVRRHHPLAAAGSALEHLVLGHFGFRVIRGETAKEPPAHVARPPGDAPGSS
jgi:hypothetical protein